MDGVRSVAKMLFAAADLFHRRPPGPRILIYHQIGAGLGRQMEVTEEDFVRQIDWMQEHGEIVDLETALERRDESGSDRLFVLTFDDGYRDVYANGFPLLKERGLPFTLYLATESIESGLPLTSGGRAEPLTWDQIGEMNESGLMTIGTHTHSHVDLRTVSGSEAEKELDLSNQIVASRTGVIPRHFAYPWGYWDEIAHQLVRERFDTAVLGSGAPISKNTSPLLLNRIPIQLSDRTLFFRTKATSGMQLEDRVRRRLRGYFGP